MDVSVVIPTFREADNLPILIPQVAEALARAGLDGEILIVDDNSPDATANVCADLSRNYPVRLLVRTTERGLSSAVIHGLRHARGDFLVVMDADLSHPPEKVPELLRPLSEGTADFVIGSRYVSGGATAGDWGWFRWLNSKVATWLAVPLAPVNDPMAGFFALRRETFLSADKLDPIGYKIGLELIVKCSCKKTAEVPIFFRDRLHGESKLTMKEQINYLRHLRRLYEYRYGAWVRRGLFALVGATGMVVDLTMVLLLLFLAVPFAGARALAIVVAMTWNFFLSRWVTFATARERPFVQQYLLYALSCSAGAALNWATTMTLSSTVEWFDQWKVAASAVGIAVGMVSNYLFCSRIVFPKPQQQLEPTPAIECAPTATRTTVEEEPEPTVGVR
jgi:dolichol-phosphate mannosyltransferase